MRTVLKWLCIFVALLVVLVVLGSNFEDFRAQRDWARCKAELEAKGEHLNLDYFIPPPVPDEKNFALTPLMKPLLDLVKDPATGEYVARDPDSPLTKISAKVRGATMDFPATKSWNTGNARNLEPLQNYYRKSLPELKLSKSPAEDILTVVGRFDRMFAELRDDMKTRPLCRYPLHYELGYSMALPHLHVLQQMISVLSLRASADLQLNQTDAAFADVQLGFALARTLRDESMAIDGLTRSIAIAILIPPVWEGIAAHRWNAEQLAALETELQGWDFLSDFNRCMRMERAGANSLFVKIFEHPESIATMSKPENEQIVQIWKALGPVLRASIYRNQIMINTYVQDKFLTIADPKAQAFSVPRAKDAETAIKALPTTPYNMLGKIMLLVFTDIPVKFAQAQTWLDEAQIACEIERYRLAHGLLPATLEALQMQNLPHDIINGQSLHYRLDGADNYFLYSVGWNETDDGGKVVMKDDGRRIDYQQGDWVWTLKPL